MHSIAILLQGFLLGMTLIISLGPQNVFLVRLSAQKNHANLAVIICFICDIILIAGSIIGLHHLIETHPAIEHAMIILGALFLFIYGGQSLKSSLSGQNIMDSDSHRHQHTRLQIILLALGFSLLNPQAIIDSLVIIGSNSSQFTGHKALFCTGVLIASFIWFIGLSATTRYFSGVLSQPKIWARLELCSGLLMILIGGKLLMQLWI